ncbi:MAG: cytochrome b [Cellvibrionales bacterium]|nr:cytochrome b [Cellvibrionales bacterium]
MPLKNTAANYGTIAKWLHWGTALLFLGAYVSVYYRQWFTAPCDANGCPTNNWNALQLHLSIGISIGVIVLLRILWRLYNRPPTPEPGTRLEHLAIKTGHYALYAIMILAPLTGYMGTGINTDFFFLFEVPKFESTPLSSTLLSALNTPAEQFEKVVDFIHKDILGRWLIWILIAGHTTAALYHHFIKKDRTLQKMTTGK